MKQVSGLVPGRGCDPVQFERGYRSEFGIAGHQWAGMLLREGNGEGIGISDGKHRLQRGGFPNIRSRGYLERDGERGRRLAPRRT